MSRPFCDGRTRRDALRLGAASLFGAPVTLPRLLASDARPAADNAAVATSVIYVFLRGGLSTIDTFDLKPYAPGEFRGEFQPIRTALPGVTVCEHLPRTAAALGRFSQVRSFRHHDSNHGPADHYMLTGYYPQPGFNPTASPNNQRPSFGSAIAERLGPRGAVPAYVAVPKAHPSGGSAFLGPAAAPLAVDADPSAPDFAVRDLTPPPSIRADRLADRRRLLADLDRYQKSAEEAANRVASSVGAFQVKAFDLMTSPAAKAAFDLSAEPDKLRDEYGRQSLGQCCLLARRLVESGVRCVTIDHSNWDTHDGNFKVLKNTLLPQFDAAIPTLFRDLADRGMLGRTLVVVTGEFGRTPRINKNAGRDHWGPAFTVLLGGGGVVGGRVVGASDARAERPATAPYGPEDLAATVYRQLGIDPAGEFQSPDGRPVPLVNNGKLMGELF